MASQEQAWAESQTHALALEGRLERLTRVREQGANSTSPIAGVRLFQNSDESKESKLPAGLCWQLMEPIETRFPREMDCVYGMTGRTPF